MNDRSWLVILVFGIWLFLSCFLGNLISVLNGIDSITPIFSFLSFIFFSHSRYDCSSQCFPRFFVFCFVFPQGSEPFHKCCVICFVQQNSLHARTTFSPTHLSFPMSLSSGNHSHLSRSLPDVSSQDITFLCLWPCSKYTKECLTCTICSVSVCRSNGLS